MLATVVPSPGQQHAFVATSAVEQDGEEGCLRKFSTEQGGCSLVEVRSQVEAIFHGGDSDAFTIACNGLVAFVLTNPERFLQLCPQGVWLGFLLHAFFGGGFTSLHLENACRWHWPRPPTADLWSRWLPTLEALSRKLPVHFSVTLPQHFSANLCNARSRSTDSAKVWQSRVWADGQNPVLAWRHFSGTRTHIARGRQEDTVAAFLLGHSSKWQLPSRVRRMIIDVGVHLGSEFTANIKKDPKLFLLGFEPMHDVFSAAVSFAERYLPAAALGRVLYLPAAVGQTYAGAEATSEGFVSQFYVAGDPSTGESWYDGMCSSLEVPIGGDQDIQDRTCGRVMRREDVLVVPLAAILSRLPPAIFVELKIDAQGHDMAVVESGSSLVSAKVQRIVMEVQDLPPGDANLGYADQVVRSQIIERMRTLGFEEEYCDSFGENRRREMDCYFKNALMTSNTTPLLRRDRRS